MSAEIARYQFHAWARRGIAANILESDHLGAGSSPTIEHAEIPVSVTLNTTVVPKTFSLIGPGDITGIDSKMIVRTEPLNWITDYEPNYLAFLEFYDEDFIWRYTPAAPAGVKLRPWLSLVVLKEGEFERTKRKLPLRSINITDKTALPPHNETWMWGHVHSNADIPDAELSDYEAFLLSLNKTANDDPDQLFCRLMSPRKLEPNTKYYAFVVPAFETGRLAGLELPTATTPAQQASWDAAGAKGEMPVYYEWFFKTGVNSDFESLVKLLEPRPMDPKVGIRDMDASRPGFVKAAGGGEIPGTSPAILGLEGALKSPSTQSTAFPVPAQSSFQQELQKIVNLPAVQAANMTEDPVVSVPLYGGKHAKKSATDVVLLDVSKAAWVHDLNRDPRTRVPAGFGTLVIQKNQENYMQRAWAQVEKILEANRAIRATSFLMQVSSKYTQQTFSKLAPNVLMGLSRPLHARIMGGAATVHQQIEDSLLPAALFSGTFRRIARPNGRLIRTASATVKFSYQDLVDRVNAGKLTPSPPKKRPPSLPDTSLFASKIYPPPGGTTVPKTDADKTAAASLTDPALQPELVRKIPLRNAFRLELSDEAVRDKPKVYADGTESPEGKTFRKALIDFVRRVAVRQSDPVYAPLNATAAYGRVVEAIHPYKAYPARLASRVRFPAYIPLQLPEKIYPAMAYPDFEDPMYKKLVEISTDLLLPNLKLIPQNSISLLKTNQKFIEAYMVGLNHEMGRELLWREYPTDERPSSFRQFWDVKGIVRPADGKTEAQLTEEYKDIKPIHTWSSGSLLGRHNNRDAQDDPEQVVLTIRGDLLKRYPNTVIFAQKAIPGMGPKAEPLVDLDLTDAEFKKHLKFPLYKAEVLPDIKFFGFDLTVEEARGTAPSEGFADDLGWFFVIQEVPGEPRFGMDVKYDAGSDGLSWDDLAWTHFDAGMKFITAGAKPNFTPPDSGNWAKDAANMASILFQKPAMIAVHAEEMLQSLSV